MEKASEVSIGVKFLDQNGILFLEVYDLNAKIWAESSRLNVRFFTSEE